MNSIDGIFFGQTEKTEKKTKKKTCDKMKNFENFSQKMMVVIKLH